MVSFLNPYNMIARCMPNLESRLSKASLLHESWGPMSPISHAILWREHMRVCHSLDGSVVLLVALADAIHPRAFDEGWLVCADKKASLQTAAGKMENGFCL